jgi:general secretion pathway protein J
MRIVLNNLIADGKNGRNGGGIGFTLIEILIAVTIFAVVLAAINTVFYSAIRLRNQTTQAVEAAMPLEQALAVIQHDLANIVASPTGMLMGPLTTISVTNALQGQVGPDFYTSAGELDGLVPWGNIQKVDYLLAPSPSGGLGRDLVRAVTRNLLSTTALQPETQQPLLSGVQNVTFLYYDGTQWDSSWDTPTQTNLPTAIKVQIQMAPQSKLARLDSPLELVVPMDVLVSTNQTTAIQ